MKDRIIKWAKRVKEKENTFTAFCRLIYLIGLNPWIHSLFITMCGIFIPITLEKEKYLWFFFLFIGLILDTIFFYICDEFSKELFLERKLDSVFLSDNSSLLNSFVINVINNDQWKSKIFGVVSNLVCEKIRTSFREVLDCNTRVSVEYIFDKERRGKTEKYVKMAGRRSPNRDVCTNAKPFDSKCKYYSHKIFIRNNKGLNILNEDKIKNPRLWYVNNEINIKKYLGYAVSLFDDGKINYILQIDCLDDVQFGKNNTEDEIKEFFQTYLWGYINILNLSYLLNFNKGNKISEV